MMNKMKVCFLFLLLLSFSSSLYAHEFKFIKLAPLMEERLRVLTQKPSLSELRKSNQKMLRSLSQGKASGVISAQGGGPFEDPNMSPVYSKIVELLSGNFQKIGNDEAESILAFNRQFNLGEENFSGFSWQKPMGKFSVSANRVIRPYLFSTTVWIVEDTFSIYIDATSFLKNMKSEGLIDISEANIGLFAGLSFKRNFRYEHFASSYNEGLFSDFSKLFMSWNIFSLKPIMNLSQYEIVTKEDQVTASVGGKISSPPIYGFSGAAGVLVTYNHIGKTVIQKLGPDDKPAEGEFLRVASTKSNAVSVAATAQIQLDFLKLVKLTLFSYDFEYEHGKSQTVNLSFFEKDREKLTGNTAEAAEFKHLIGIGTTDIKALQANVVSLDQREQQNMDSKFGFLLFGVMKKKETEQIKIVKNGNTKLFFRTHFENLKTVQNFFSRFLNTAIYALVKIDLGAKLDASLSRQVDMEYDYQHDGSQDDVLLDSEEKLSVTLQKRYEARDTTGFFRKTYKNHAISIMQDYSGLSADFITMVRKDELQGPLVIHTIVRLEEAALKYFNQQNPDELFLSLALICGSRRPNQWRKSDFRGRALKRLQVGPDACVKKLGKDYLAYREDLDNYHQINLKKFRNFTINLHKETDRIHDLYKFFGEKNLFFNGYFAAKTKSGNNFSTFFQDGVFRGLGVVDNYLRANRSPSSIGLE
ncbi:MAG: hypothetical protein ACOYL6_00100 [Bacteriovoracaceae bacterium]